MEREFTWSTLHSHHKQTSPEFTEDVRYGLFTETIIKSNLTRLFYVKLQVNVGVLLSLIVIGSCSLCVWYHCLTLELHYWSGSIH